MSVPTNRGGRKPDPESLAARARAAGIDPFTVYHRIHAGWTLERALATKPPQRTVTVAELARAKGLKPDTVRTRINKQGLTLTMALHRPLQRKRNAGRGYALSLRGY